VAPLTLSHVCIARQKANSFNPLISVRNLKFLHGKADCLPKAARARPIAVGPAGSIVHGLPKNSRPTTPGLALISWWPTTSRLHSRRPASGQRFAGQHLVRGCAGLTCGGVHNTYFWIDLKKLMQIMERQVIYAMLEISA
jgi:hypothetical protein